MADGYKLWRTCPGCKGTGTQPRPDETGTPIEETCVECAGNGYYLWGWCTVDTFAMPAMPE